MKQNSPKSHYEAGHDEGGHNEVKLRDLREFEASPLSQLFDDDAEELVHTFSHGLEHN